MAFTEHKNHIEVNTKWWRENINISIFNLFNCNFLSRGGGRWKVWAEWLENQIVQLDLHFRFLLRLCQYLFKPSQAFWSASIFLPKVASHDQDQVRPDPFERKNANNFSSISDVNILQSFLYHKLYGLGRRNKFHSNLHRTRSHSGSCLLSNFQYFVTSNEKSSITYNVMCFVTT